MDSPKPIRIKAAIVPSIACIIVRPRMGIACVYQAYEPGETEVASARQGKDSDRDKAEQ